MKLIVLFGMPATGKLTVAQELAALTGCRLFHNHLAVDLLLSVFDFGSPGFVELREQIWLSVFRAACREGVPYLLFTFAPEASVGPAFIDNMIQTVESEGGSVDFVELTCPIPELRRRIDSASRRSFKKLTSVETFDQLHGSGALTNFPMPAPRLSFDTSLCTPAEASHSIARALGLSAPVY
jgi:hypothetical protein